MLTREAWNAFLKTLEEPPPNTVFVLATTEPHKVMPTIVDRCQRFDFQRPAARSRSPRSCAGSPPPSRSRSTTARSRRSPARPPAASATRSARSTSSSPTAANEIETDDVLAVLGVAEADLILGGRRRDRRRATDARRSRSASASPRSGRDVSAVRPRPARPPAPAAGDPDRGRRGRRRSAVTAADPERLRGQAEAFTDLGLTRGDRRDRRGARGDPRGRRAADDGRARRPPRGAARARPLPRGSMQRLERIERCWRAIRAPLPAPAPEAEQAAEPPSRTADRRQHGRGGSPEPRRRRGRARPRAGRRTCGPRCRPGPRLGLGAAVARCSRSPGRSRSTSTRPCVKVGFPASAAFNKRKAEAADARDRFAEAVNTIVGERLRPVFVLLDGDEAEAAAAAGEG